MSLPVSMKHLLNTALKRGGLTFAEAQEALSLLSSDDIITACDACASLLIGGGPLDMPHLVANCVRLYALAHDRVPERVNILFALANNARDILDYPEIRQLVLNAGSSGNPNLEINAGGSLHIMARKGDADAVQIIQKLANSSDEYVRGNATKALAGLAAR